MSSRTLRSSREPCASEQDSEDTIRRPAKRRRVGKGNDTRSQSSKPTVDSTKSQWTTYRASQIPDTYDEGSFLEALHASLQLDQHTTLTTHSFASNRIQGRSATITFSNTPTKLCSAEADAGSKRTEWLVDIVHPLSTQTDTICIDTHFRGFTPISPVANDEEHLIDCIVIHGWGSHPLGGFKAHDSCYVWLRDSLAKDLPRLRIFLYGYECDLTTADSIGGVDDYADTLRRLLRNMRGQDKVGNIESLVTSLTMKTGRPVPLVFIAHSLGGIVLKQAIIRMKESSDSNDQHNLNSIYGLLFFGVPNQGMETGALAAMIGDKPQRYHLSLLDEQVGHRLSSRQHEQFCRAFDFEDSRIIQFFETKKTRTVAQNGITKKWARTGPEKLLVKPSSATFGRRWDTSEDFKVSIEADHSNMVKFSRFDQDGYLKARDELRKFTEEAIPIIEERLRRIPVDKSIQHQHRGKSDSVLNMITDQEDITCLRSLAFPEMHYRRQDLQRAHANTCGWISSHRSYTAWLKDGSGILWVKGKPGSGKSTLMGFLLRDFETQPLYQKSIQISFFCHGRGTMLQKSRIGMYRSLLHQLLLKAPNAGAEFRHAFQERSRSQGEPGVNWDWHTNELRDFLMLAVEHVASTRPVNIFVDALDEANDGFGDDHTSHQIVSDFHDLNDRLHRKKLRSTICFSCRHFPIVADNEGRDICVEDENHADISTYVADQLRRRLSRRETDREYLEKLQDTIITKAQGVFQWAALVVALVIRSHNYGITPEEIMQMLEKVPEKLADVYKHILSEVIDKEHHQQTLRLLRCVYLAERPLTITEMSFAMSLPDFELSDSEFPLVILRLPTQEVMGRRITSLSGGLVEHIKHEGDQIVQFIHQSVNDFLSRDGLRFLDKSFPRDPTGLGHHQLSLICANYLIMAEIGNSKHLDDTSIKKNFPFADYAIRSWFLHAEKAEKRGVRQDYLLYYNQNFPKMLEHWSRCYRILDNYRYAERRPEKSLTLLHIASAANLLSVVESLISTHVDLEQEDDSGGRALHHASRWGHNKVVIALIDAGSLIDAQNNDMYTPLERAVANGHEHTVGLLLAMGADVNKKTGDTGNALSSAAARGSLGVVQILLINQAEVNAQGGCYSNALQAAARWNNQAVIQLLLNNGAEVNAQGGIYSNALQAATTIGNQEIVQLLLDSGAEVNAQGGRYGNALRAAATIGNQEVVQLLLDNGAEENFGDLGVK